MKKVIKAHEGMAHVPKPSNQQAPSKAKGTAGTTPRTPKRRMIGLPQQFRGSRRRMPTAAAPQDAPPMVRPTQAVLEPAIVKKPKPVREPVRDSCPSPDTLINLSNNETKQARDLAVGDTVYTQHENTLEWGDYTVSHVSIVPNSERIQLVFDTTEIVCSLSHKMYVFNKGWTKAKDIEIDDIVSGHTLKDKVEWETGDVVKITIEEAHSYIAAGLLSHNKRYASPVQQKPKPKPQSFRVPASRAPKVIPQPVQPRIMNKGGYISRAKYGIVDNIKKGK